MRAKQTIVETVKFLYDRGLSSGTGGNVALKCGDKFYLTPHGMGPELRYDIGPDDIIVYDMKGNKIHGNREPSVEGNMHLGILMGCPAASASIHAHPYYATVFAYAGKQIPVDMEATRELVGEMPVIDIAPAGSKKLADDVINDVLARSSEIESHGIGLLLALHGMITVGRTMAQALGALEAAEEAARCALLSRLLQ